MRDLLRMVRELPLAVKMMLLCAMARSVSFFALLAYLPIYMHESLGLNGAMIGYVLGLCLLVGTVVSVYGGYLADRFVKIDFIIVLDLLLTALYATLPLMHSSLVVAGFLLVANTASSSMGVANNALLSELVPSEVRTKVFSLRYSLQNIGAAVGPFLGAWTVRSHASGPFELAAATIFVALLPLMVFRRHFVRPVVPAAAKEASGDKEELDFKEVLKVMRADRRLGLFTLGGILSIVVYGPLLTYMSQYLVIVESRDTAYQLVAYISAANAAVVITMQYVLGSRLREKTLLKWLTWGIAAFVVGLVAMSVSTQSWVLVLAIAVFTLGEVIVVPAEYMFVDSIAPDNLRGSYFGAQNLIHIGMAFGPIMCGFLLDHAAPAVMFYALIAVVIAGWWFYVLGCRAAVARDAVPVNA